MKFFFQQYKNKTDEQLMQLVYEGKEQAFDELYERYAKKMHYFFWKMLGNDKEKANDFVQDLFLKVIEKTHLFHNERKFSTWFYTVAGNMCKNEYRKNALRNEVKDYAGLQNIPEKEEFSPAFDAPVLNDKIQVEINNLGEEQKMIFILRFQENLSVKEISEIMDCPEGTIKSRLFYSAKKIAEKLKAYNPY